MTDILPCDKRLKFFVYVIESPSPVDLYHRRSEGEMLRQAINLNQIACTLRLAVNLEAFTAAIRIGLHEAMEAFPNTIPILHISAHGFSEGIQLSSGEVVLWHQLRELLIPVNQALSGSLIVCMSTCEGYSGSRMAMVPESNDHPFWAIIGNCGKPNALTSQIEKYNEDWKGLDCEIEDLLGQDLIELFLEENPNSLRRDPIVMNGRCHYEWTDNAKGKIFNFTKQYASLNDITELVEILKSLRFYLGLPAEGI